MANEELREDEEFGEDENTSDGHLKQNVKMCDNCGKPLEMGEVILCNTCLPF